MFLGIEIGGTKLQLGLGDGDGRIAALRRSVVDRSAGGAGIRGQIEAAIPDLLAEAGADHGALRGIGIGFGGPVDDGTRTVIKSHQIDGWDGFPLADWFEDMLDLPTVLGNDADVAGLAEAHFGAGKGLSPIFYITIGSGIGGGLIIDGRIHRGCGRGAAEIGHLRTQGWHVNDRSWLGYGDAIVEHCASGWAIERRAAAMGRDQQPRDSSLMREIQDRPEAVTAALVGRHAASGDDLALRVLHDAWTALATGMSHVIALVCPQRFVIGGGVSMMGDELFFDPLRIILRGIVFQPFADCCDIVPAALGEEVVVHGALALARQTFGERGASAP